MKIYYKINIIIFILINKKFNFKLKKFLFKKIKILLIYFLLIIRMNKSYY